LTRSNPIFSLAISPFLLRLQPESGVGNGPQTALTPGVVGEENFHGRIAVDAQDLLLDGGEVV
jgi:hypothetical protein